MVQMYESWRRDRPHSLDARRGAGDATWFIILCVICATWKSYVEVRKHLLDWSSESFLGLLSLSSHVTGPQTLPTSVVSNESDGMQGTEAGQQPAWDVVELQGKDCSRVTTVNYRQFRNHKKEWNRLIHSNQKVTGSVSGVNRSEMKGQNSQRNRDSTWSSHKSHVRNTVSPMNSRQWRVGQL